MDKKKLQKNIFKSHSLAATLLLLLYIGTISLVYTFFINDISTQNCYSDLSAGTKEACHTIENNFRNDRSSLRLLSRVIAHESDMYSNEVNNYMTTYDVNTLISNIAILMPNNEIVQSRGQNSSSEGFMDYNVEHALGEHISNLRKSTITENTTVMYSFIPIRISGKTVAMLFTELNPSAIAMAWSPEIYDGEASFCIIDRSTGEVLINDWNEEIENISDIGSAELSESISSGEDGFLQMKFGKDEVFVSYMPMELENWEIMFIVGKDKVFDSANKMHNIMGAFLIAGAVGFVVYLLWLMWSNRRSIINAETKANVDVLTGLQNRNLYEQSCKALTGKEKDLACIYIDANGLHEINNTKGHLAGDQMLRFIADTLKVSFGENMVYRIGGDEFIVFQKKKSLDEIENILSEIDENLSKNNYHVSTGVCIGDNNIELNELIKTAEKRMYDNKKKYYESLGKDVRNKIE